MQTKRWGKQKRGTKRGQCCFKMLYKVIIIKSFKKKERYYANWDKWMRNVNKAEVDGKGE